MRFELLDSLSLPGNPEKPNDDALGFSDHAALVLDGATGLGEPLMPGKSDAAWLARFGANRILAHANEGDPPGDAVRHALEDAQKSFDALRRREPAERYELPFASLMFASVTDDGFEALWFGDCAALVRRPDGSTDLVGEAIAKRELEAARVAQLAAKHGLSPAAGTNRPEYLAALRRARNHVNTGKGGWLFGPDARAADHVASRQVEAPAGSLVLLMTDGFLALVSDYRRYTAAKLIEAANTVGLRALGEELRRIEMEDTEGKAFPRFKTNDDATALLLRLA